jgi:hypothetical protein
MIFRTFRSPACRADLSAPAADRRLRAALREDVAAGHLAVNNWQAIVR